MISRLVAKSVQQNQGFCKRRIDVTRISSIRFIGISRDKLPRSHDNWTHWTSHRPCDDTLHAYEIEIWTLSIIEEISWKSSPSTIHLLKEEQHKHVIWTLWPTPSCSSGGAEDPKTSSNSMKLQICKPIKNLEIHQPYDEVSLARLQELS